MRKARSGKTFKKVVLEKGLIAFVRDELTESQPLQKMPWIRKLSDLPKELKKELP